MMEIAELRIEVRKLDCVTLRTSHVGYETPEVIPAVVTTSAVTDRLLVSEEAVQVLGVGR